MCLVLFYIIHILNALDRVFDFNDFAEKLLNLQIRLVILRYELIQQSIIYRCT